ncbi:MAG: putative toxin-antitoxin system toxin component, PIN family [Cyanobacteriota/Melainabacteria group bacterium]
MLKAVIDTSVFIAGFLSRTGNGYSAQIISRWRAGEFQLIMSRQILEEVVGKLVEKGIDDNLILEFVEVIGKIALNIPGSYIVYRLDDVDPDDNMFLAASQEGCADYLVSLDAKHLLPLKHHKGTQIVEPELFLRALDKEPPPHSMTKDDYFEKTEEEVFNEEFAKELHAARQELVGEQRDD